MTNPFMQALLTGRGVTQTTQIQPMKASVEKVEYKARNVTLWSKTAATIHATRDILSAPIWGSTKPNDFITINGQMPKAPVIIKVPTIQGSNMPEGGYQI